ncbi:MAG: methionyl-tRNA formyltransferase [Colwellia sp.]|nr:methionyl-tRNA formyltransferase [Colwellia sp.]
MGSYLIVSQHQRHQSLFSRLQTTLAGQWQFISEPAELTVERLSTIAPDYIFLPHWSHKIPAEITENFACIMFHMTDLPFGRGGSPLQNLIVRGFKETQLSAFRCSQQLDAGPVYSKLPLSLSGSAEEIFSRADNLVSQLIFDIIQRNIEPLAQTGEVTEFKRRTPEQGNLSQLAAMSDIYDYIRMLDAKGYPKAFLNMGPFTLNFSQAKLLLLANGDEQISAQVTFKKNYEGSNNDK